jgi:hypothetical protein
MTDKRPDSAQTHADDLQAEARLVAGIRRELDASCRALDGQTLSRLNSIRHAALERKRPARRGALLLPFGGLVTAAVLVLSISLVNSGRTPETEFAPVNAPLEDIDLLTENASLELFEDYEFYQWLAENGSTL